MAALFADESYPRPVVLLLRAAGHDVVTAQEEGIAGRDDPDILAIAAAAGRIVLTEDWDFVALHKASAPHAGIIHCSRDNDWAALAARIDAAAPTAGPGLLVRARRPHRP
ncbi:MAG: DUF5615 family PIN-like protein [Gemmataceae bacterium]|nr:DUF5615 family PIN-like protein [Gemmataceae bacterium]